VGKQSQFKANSKPIKANKMPKQTQYKAKQTQFQRQKNAAAFSAATRHGDGENGIQLRDWYRGAGMSIFNWPSRSAKFPQTKAQWFQEANRVRGRRSQRSLLYDRPSPGKYRQMESLATGAIGRAVLPGPRNRLFRRS